MGANKTRRWTQKAKRDCTHPPRGLFTKDAEMIADILATKRVSPAGFGASIRMLEYFIHRDGKSLTVRRRNELEKAKRILQERKALEEGTKA